ncbi:hypothetical protein [Bacteroides caecimuris]|uniref:hypothetical protein n=1 Tax=Bacteroides caecimuris TaxID=1796613 RepID=UPI00272AC290|nr:hypothetical protein [Bacteroides caecimuris]
MNIQLFDITAFAAEKHVPCPSAHKGLQVDDLQTFYHKSKQEHTDARSRRRPEL